MKIVKIGVVVSLFLLVLVFFLDAEHEPKHRISTVISKNFMGTGLVQLISRELNSAGVQLSDNILSLALLGFNRLHAQDRLNRDSILTIIDFSRSSREKRLFAIDLKKKKLLMNSWVAHGRNLGTEYATQFPNIPSSHQSSLGFYITAEVYAGFNGYSLALEGQEKGFNDLARKRAIVIHGADHANGEWISNNGYLGRSFRCPALPTSINKKVIDLIKGGSCVFIYHPEKKYVNGSRLLNGSKLLNG